MSTHETAERRVLVVEDEPDMQNALTWILQDEGYQVVVAEHGQEALEMLTRDPLPCLILLDLAMPVMDGWEFRTRQRNNPALEQIPVVAITGGAYEVGKVLAAGFADYITKPIEINSLLAMVAQYCR